jgi:AsmA protein
MFGSVEIDFFQFVRPKFNFRVYEDGSVGWHFPEGRVWDVLKQARNANQAIEGQQNQPVGDLPVVKLGEFEIIDGLIEYENRNSQTRETITNINAHIVWPNTASPLTMWGSGIWRDEAFDISVRSDKALMLFAGGGASLDFSAKSAALAMRFTGTANTLSDLHLSGDLQFSSPSLRRISHFLDRPVVPGSTLAGFEAKGKLTGTMRQMQLNDASISLDGNRGRGVLQIAERKPGRAFINGTLAFDAIDFTPYVSALQQDIAIGKNTLPAGDLLNLVDMDLRLSATQARLYGLKLSNFAASLNIQDNRALFNIGNANLFNGTLDGELALSEKDGMAGFNARAMFTDFDAERVNAALGTSRLRLQGKGKVEIQAASSGNAAIELARNLKGQAQFELSNGVITGIDLETLRSTVRAAPSGSESLEPGGQTPFEQLTGSIAFNNSSAWIRSMYLFAPSIAAQIAGRSAIDLSAIALRFRLGPPVDAEARIGLAGSGFPNDALVLVGGSVMNPLITWVPIVAAPATADGQNGHQIGN